MIEIITLGAGCFWCVEAVFTSIPGVTSVDVGYSNGDHQHPTYESVCTGSTGHAEVAQISFDSNLVSFEEILDIFFLTHDPTTLNKQGGDIGTQYRSGIFYHTDEQKNIAEKKIIELNNSSLYESKVVTEISKINNYHLAEDYHQEYYKNNQSAPYCQFVIKPKLEKLNK